jgi:hypothetical protein
MKYLCTKDYVMLDTKKIAFKKGNIYNFNTDYWTDKNEWGGTHNMKDEMDFNQYFKPLDTEINTPSHYDNSKGTLYKVAQERGWNPYLFDIVKRLERAEKKGEFESDLDKSIAVIQLWKNEQTTKN